jgi:hypothetical protein
MIDELMQAITTDYRTIEDYKVAYNSLEYKGMGEWVSSLSPGWMGDEEDYQYLCGVIASLYCSDISH